MGDSPVLVLLDGCVVVQALAEETFWGDSKDRSEVAMVARAASTSVGELNPVAGEASQGDGAKHSAWVPPTVWLLLPQQLRCWSPALGIFSIRKKLAMWQESQPCSGRVASNPLRSPGRSAANHRATISGHTRANAGAAPPGLQRAPFSLPRSYYQRLSAPPVATLPYPDSSISVSAKRSRLSLPITTPGPARPRHETLLRYFLRFWRKVVSWLSKGYHVQTPVVCLSRWTVIACNLFPCQCDTCVNERKEPRYERRVFQPTLQPPNPANSRTYTTLHFERLWANTDCVIRGESSLGARYVHLTPSKFSHPVWSARNDRRLIRTYSIRQVNMVEQIAPGLLTPILSLTLSLEALQRIGQIEACRSYLVRDQVENQSTVPHFSSNTRSLPPATNPLSPTDRFADLSPAPSSRLSMLRRQVAKKQSSNQPALLQWDHQIDMVANPGSRLLTNRMFQSSSSANPSRWCSPAHPEELHLTGMHRLLPPELTAMVERSELDRIELPSIHRESSFVGSRKGLLKAGLQAARNILYERRDRGVDDDAAISRSWSRPSSQHRRTTLRGFGSGHAKDILPSHVAINIPSTVADQPTHFSFASSESPYGSMSGVVPSGRGWHRRLPFASLAFSKSHPKDTSSVHELSLPSDAESSSTDRYDLKKGESYSSSSLLRDFHHPVMRKAATSCQSNVSNVSSCSLSVIQRPTIKTTPPEGNVHTSFDSEFDGFDLEFRLASVREPPIRAARPPTMREREPQRLPLTQPVESAPPFATAPHLHKARGEPYVSRQHNWFKGSSKFLMAYITVCCDCTKTLVLPLMLKHIGLPFLLTYAIAQLVLRTPLTVLQLIGSQVSAGIAHVCGPSCPHHARSPLRSTTVLSCQHLLSTSPVHISPHRFCPH
eukprot:Blabericola_migrator_1__2674@NODE_175_length_12037_cov_81_938346_g152_i0_p1_GENE_NODE_175_length_12037_cov_81_938346_g152_i0NODE_175_length_12037_cov_81_938346_g152_i0_p1_ORF_typecomplete_len889_score68_58_NODE_175_length_12037_cov_81_938346_g152_i051047770